MGKLDGKVAIITGASHGLGRGIALRFAQEGCKVVVAARTEAQLTALAAEIQQAGAVALAVPTDMTAEKQIEQLFAQTAQRFGRLDILINNAAALGGAPIEQFSTEQWNNALAVNLTAPFLCTRAAFPLMKKSGGGRIVNVASIAARRVRPNSASYAATKAGLWGLTQETALEGREHNIVVSCIFPGNIRTEARNSADSDFNREPMMSVAEVAEAVLFMATQPPHLNVLELLMLPTQQAYLGRG